MIVKFSFIPPSMHVRYTPMDSEGKRGYSDGVGKILLRTPSYGSKITGSHDGKEYGKSDKYWKG